MPREGLRWDGRMGEEEMRITVLGAVTAVAVLLIVIGMIHFLLVRRDSGTGNMKAIL